jgi:aminoglycoside/choline kinase family phosphotransferase
VSTSETESSFYRELAPTLDVRVPECIYSGFDRETGHGLILMEDLVEQGCRFLTARSPYSLDQVAGSLDQLAALNAARWDDPTLLQLSYIAPRIAMISTHVTLDRLQTHLDGPRADGLPAGLRDAQRVQDAVSAVFAQASEHPRCLVHGDAHAGNLYLTPDEQVGLIDWQVLQAGWWALDVAYHVGAVLEPDQRQQSERDLLTHYLDRLGARGAPAPDWDDAWLQYRTAIAYGYYMWAITKFVDPDIITLFVQRLGAAAAQHGTYELLGV